MPVQEFFFPKEDEVTKRQEAWVKAVEPKPVKGHARKGSTLSVQSDADSLALAHAPSSNLSNTSRPNSPETSGRAGTTHLTSSSSGTYSYRPACMHHHVLRSKQSRSSSFIAAARISSPYISSKPRCGQDTAILYPSAGRVQLAPLLPQSLPWSHARMKQTWQSCVVQGRVARRRSVCCKARAGHGTRGMQRLLLQLPRSLPLATTRILACWTPSSNR